jgi:hypothetical protein
MALGIAGCHGEAPPPPDKATEQQSSRLHEIQTRTGGDWNKLSEDDKHFLVDEVAHGSEYTAKMLLSAGSQKGPQKPGQVARPGK